MLLQTNVLPNQPAIHLNHNTKPHNITQMNNGNSFTDKGDSTMYAFYRVFGIWSKYRDNVLVLGAYILYPKYLNIIAHFRLRPGLQR